MQSEPQQLERYLHDALGVTVTATPWHGTESLPAFLRDLYTFAHMNLLGMDSLLAFDANPKEQAPAAIRKHMELLTAKLNEDVVYVRNQVTAYNRKRLIEHKVPFIVPGNQMYLPLLAIDLREHFRRLRWQPSTLSPSAQALLIHVLLRDAGDDLIPLKMAARLGYSTMTMTRAFDELEAADLGMMTTTGRERYLRFTGDRRETWTKAQPFLRSPVTKRLFIRRVEVNPGQIRAGLTALAGYSMLTAPPYMTYALSREDWKHLRNLHNLIEIPAQDPDALEIEVWSYRPLLFAERDIVDRLSLYLSLQGESDERTQAALDEMMRQVRW